MTSERIKTSNTEQNIQKAAEIFKVHGDFLLNVFQKELNEQDARDLWQNLFLSLIKRPAPDHVLNMRSYLYRAAVNDIVDFKRSLKFKKEKMQEYSDILRQQSRDSKPISHMIDREAFGQALKDIKLNLPPAIGQALLHKYSDNLSHREIAEKMNIKKSTVTRYLSVGTKMMEQVQDQAIGEENGRT